MPGGHENMLLQGSTAYLEGSSYATKMKATKETKN